MALSISSPGFKNGEAIPPRFTGDGEGVSPRLEWSGIPEQAQSLALIADDPDAPGGTFTHWVIFNIPASSPGLPQGVPNKSQLHDRSLQGRNDSGGVGYYGPYPPRGSHHRYYFTLYALDKKLDLRAGASKEQLLGAMQGHILEQGKLYGLYQRTPGFQMR